MAWKRSTKLCGPHTSGVSVGMPAFYYPECARCREKLEHGLVTGNEGPLDKNWSRKLPRPYFRSSKILSPFRK
jgi:hypothetical protein